MDLSKYVAASDKRLFVVKDGEKRSIPVWVTRLFTEKGDEHVDHICVAMGVDVAVHDRMVEILKPRAIGYAGETVLIDDVALHSHVIEKVDGVTPSLWYRWDESEASRPEVPPLDKIENTPSYPDELIKEVTAKTQMLSAQQMKIVWAALLQTIMNKLLVEHSPVHLGFATLFAVPYRSNWKSILMGAFPLAYSAFCKGSEEKRMESAERMGITMGFRYKELLEIEQNGTAHQCHWKIEVVPTKLWESAQRKTEEQRMAAGPESYARHIAKSIRRLKPLIFGAFRYFIVRSIAPSADISDLGTQGGQILKPWTPKGGIRPSAQSRSCTDIVGNASTVDETDEELLLSGIQREIAALSKLPDLQQTAAKLRITRGRVAE